MKSLRRVALEALVARRPRQALQLASRQLPITGLQLRVPEDSPLFSQDGGQFIELPLDEVIAPFVLDHGQWQTEELDFISGHLPDGPCVLLDIGANVGLITRQLMHRLPALAAAVCFEPHPGNFAWLARNLAHLPQCRLVQAAVGPQAGELHFYEELHNAGNYSLNSDAMRGKQFRTSSVRCVAATPDNLLSALPDALRSCPVIWKSDTQGFDEVIVTSLPMEFWNRVHAGVMEIWRIARPAFDEQRLAAMLALFPVRRFSDDIRKNLRVDEVLAFAAGDDYDHRDLFFART